MTETMEELDRAHPEPSERLARPRDRSALHAPHFFPASSLAGQEVPERPWLVQDIIPLNTVTMLSGDGGTGKSLLSLQLACATALGRSWMRESVSAGRVLFITAEDDRDEVHRRLASIASAEGVELSDLADLTILSLAGEDALLVDLEGKSTGLLLAIEKRMSEEPVILLVLDTLADFFPGNENDRAQARQFVGKLRGIALHHQCAVLLLSHPSLSGLGTGTGTSGSTAWNNSVRSRLYLERVRSGEVEANPDARTLKTMKANYGRIGGEIPMTYRDGVFWPTGEVSSLNRSARSAKSERVFLDLLEQITEQGRRVTYKPCETYAPKLFASMPGAGDVTKYEFQQAMERLFQQKRIEIGEEGAPSKRRSYIKATVVRNGSDAG